jgi:hypothetical protein
MFAEPMSSPVNRNPSSAERVLLALGIELRGALGAVLLGLYVHGSWIVGDFAPSRSDLDLLAVLTREPDGSLLVGLDEMHSRVEAAHSAWRGRVEVEYVALETIRRFSAGPSEADGPVIARISPGEPLHLLAASSHRLLTWASVRDTGRPLVGPPPEELLPAIDHDTARAAAMDHVRDWPTWVQEMTTPGGQAYAVLTLCRALHLFTERRQVSKRKAAGYASAALPQWAALIDWARDWWYAGGEDDEISRLAETTRFINAVSSRILTQ